MERVKFNFKEIAPCFFAILIDTMGFGLAFPVLTALFTTSDSLFPSGSADSVRYFYLGLSLLLYPLMMFFGSMFLGGLSDKIGRKKAFVICMGGLVISFASIGFGVKFNLLMLILMGRALSGLMAASQPLALAAIADLSEESNKALHMSYVAFIQGVGWVLGPLVGGVFSSSNLSRFFGFSTPFYILAVMAFIALIWIQVTFKETFSHSDNNAMSLQGLLRVFKSKAIALISIGFLLTQIGIGSYIQVILIYFEKAAHYTTFELGMFNGFLGIWFAIALLLIVPILVKRWKVESIACCCVFITGVSQLVSSMNIPIWLLWICAVPLAGAIQTAFSSIFTSYSNASDRNTQGLVLGVCGAVNALSWTLSGFAPNFVPYLTAKGVILVGAIFLLVASSILFSYSRQLPKKRTI